MTDHGYPSVSYCDIQGGYGGQGNVNIDPLFRDRVNDDYHLKSTACSNSADSPCIDVGDPDIYDGLLDCAWGLGTALSDMGAYGGVDSMLVGIDGPEVKNPIEFALRDNYPNPFNLTTLISYELIAPSYVCVDIFDLLGRRITTLINENQLPGSHSIIWDAKDAPSGIYLYRIRAENLTQTKKMALIK